MHPSILHSTPLLACDESSKTVNHFDDAVIAYRGVYVPALCLHAVASSPPLLRAAEAYPAEISSYITSLVNCHQSEYCP